ncbi:unnamed protein product [Eruca vesicaria subsp. sativa]|uniref:Uncharacterized protein n=1 Tax=Eruca vesicaria subsp. sativa TaxID=29727 RepID=A0ABC8IUR7_ERUVS|nr:unnamed protein product [Eruca vesicaria subsp. sativa]
MERKAEKPSEIPGKGRGVVLSEIPPETTTELHGVDEALFGGRDDMIGSGHQSRKMASVIVSPPLRTANMEDNVTIRSRSATRSLSFANVDSVDEGEQVIGALDDMDKNETNDATKMTHEDYDDADDDLLGEEFMEGRSRDSSIEDPPG